MCYQKQLEDLFKKWKQKYDIDPKNNVFISDGPVDKEKWADQKPKIVFLLKEAYHGKEDWDLSDWLFRDEWEKNPHTWNRVAEWTYGISKTTVEGVPEFINMDHAKRQKYIKTIAVVNLKKKSGEPNSDEGVIYNYAKFDKKEIMEELELLQPDILICGHTATPLNAIYNENNKKIIDEKKLCDNGYCFADLGCGKETIIIKYNHPAYFLISSQTKYDTVTNIYQQALKELAHKIAQK